MLERKGFGIRLGAYAIDVAIMLILLVVIAATGFVLPLFLVALLMLAVAVGYPFIEVVQARSPGKMVLGLTIAREDGAPAARDQLVQRTLVKFFPTILSFGVSAVGSLVGSQFLGTLGTLAGVGLGIALLVMSWQPLQTVRQAFWDLKARTAVFGKPAAVGFQPVMPGQVPAAGQPYPPQGVPPVPGAYAAPAGQQVPPPPQA